MTRLYISPWEVRTEASGWNTWPHNLVRDPDFTNTLSKTFTDWIYEHYEMTEPFVNTIQDDLKDDYYSHIPVEVYINLIIKRLDHGYYHSGSALINDILNMEANCHTYNQPDSQFCEVIPKITHQGLIQVYDNMVARIDNGYTLPKSVRQPP